MSPTEPSARRRVVVIEGEDAAPEAMGPSLGVIEGFGLPIDWLRPPVGLDAKRELGSTFPDEARAAIDDSDATFFGATNGASARALFYLRWGRGTYANVRPARYLAGARSPLANPTGVDFIIVRENLEDLYLGLEGEVEELEPLGLTCRRTGRPLGAYAPARYAIKLISEQGARRVVGFSFELARRRKAAGSPGRLTCATKYNMLPRSDGSFRDVAVELAADHPDIEFESFIVDDFGQRIVTNPHALDVVVMPNLYGDILSDTAAGLVGGLGLAPSGCYGDDYAYFESAHGSAPDIAGQGVINPTATLLSGAMMLAYLGFEREAKALEGAVAAVYAKGQALTPDQGGNAKTTEFCDAVRRQLDESHREVAQ